MTASLTERTKLQALVRRSGEGRDDRRDPEPILGRAVHRLEMDEDERWGRAARHPRRSRS